MSGSCSVTGAEAECCLLPTLLVLGHTASVSTKGFLRLPSSKRLCPLILGPKCPHCKCSSWGRERTQFLLHPPAQVSPSPMLIPRGACERPGEACGIRDVCAGLSALNCSLREGRDFGLFLFSVAKVVPSTEWVLRHCLLVND